MKLFFRLSFIAIVFNSICLLWPNQELQAQNDPRYTQYYQSPLRLNPAMAGVFEGMWRVGANFRTQWGSVMGGPNAYYTYALGAELKTPVFRSDFVGVSFSALTDVSGAGAYNITDINLGATYMKKLSGGRRSYRSSLTSYLVAGVQLGIGQRSVKWLNLTYSTQYVVNSNSYNQSISSGENTAGMRMTKIYPDLSAGLLWYGVLGERKSIYAGLGLFHLNSPEMSLYNRTNVGADVERMYMRVTAHAGGEFLVGGRNSSISLLPGFVGMFQGQSMELNFGLGLKYQAPRYDDFAFKLSVWSRVVNREEAAIDADAIMVVLGIDYQSFQFAVSYDINTSSLINASNGQGSLEFSVIYTHDGKHARGQGCPAFN